VKNIIASTLISLLGLVVVTEAQAEDYYIYRDPDGKLLISKKEPPSGSKIIKRHSWTEGADSEVPQSRQPNNPQPMDRQKVRPSHQRTNRSTTHQSRKPIRYEVAGKVIESELSRC
jgi:hypothetical protein